VNYVALNAQTISRKITKVTSQIFSKESSNYTPNFYFYFETEENAKAYEAVDHLTSVLSSREEISQLGIEPPTSSLRFEYLSTIIQQLRVVLDQLHTQF
jgi:hypothetical protein